MSLLFLDESDIGEACRQSEALHIKHQAQTSGDYEILETHARAINLQLDAQLVSRDGNCFYTAVDRQFHRLNGTVPMGHDVLRGIINQELRSKPTTVIYV
jgi:hypothetical protein